MPARLRDASPSGGVYRILGSVDGEARDRLGFVDTLLDGCHPRVARAGPAPLDETFHGFGFALRDDLDPAIWEVACPA